jgi:SAM-dependent methyltransferase
MVVTFWVVLILALGFGAGALLGAPYLPVLGADVPNLLKVSGTKPGDLIIDLGCGDGKLLLAAARSGRRAYGVEINPLLWLVAWLRTRRYRRLVTVRFGDYWRQDWPSDAACIYVFLITRFMPKLDQELRKRYPRPIRLVSYGFEIPGRKPDQQIRGVFAYNYGES